MEDVSRIVPLVRLREGTTLDKRPFVVALQTLLQAMDSHADDLKSIMSIVCSHMPIKSLKAATRTIDQHLEELVGRPLNQVRHHGASIELKYCSTSTFTVYGYCITSANESGVIAPSARAHGSSGSGWTFAVTVRRLLAQLVGVASQVERCLEPSSPRNVASFGEKEHNALMSVASWLESSPQYGFEREIASRVPAVSVRSGVPHLRLQTVKRLKALESLRPARWGVTHTGDGKSRSFSFL